MKTKIYLLIFLSILLASCSSLQQSTVNDDLYYSPQDELASGNDVYKNPSYDKNKSTVFNNKFDDQISEVLEDESKSNIDTTIYEDKEEYESPYDRLIVDDYSESYDRRMEALRSPYYGMNNYYNLYFSDDYWYAQSFINDPFYNVIIMGDQIWVEPYWMSSWYTYSPYRSHGYYGYGYPSYYGYGYPYSFGSYYSSLYYNPYSFYNPYYNSYYYRDYPYYSNNNNYASSAFNSYRQRSLSGVSRTGSASGRVGRDLPETYMGRDIRSSSTVKSGIDRQSNRTVRTREGSVTRSASERNIAEETIRVRETTRERSSSSVRSAGTQEPNRTYTRPQQSTRSRSTYSSPSRSATRYSRPESTSSNGSSRSTYTPNKSGSSRSGSSYTPRRSGSSSGSSTYRGSSGSSRSSGSSGSVRSSGSSGRSSGSSGSSSGSSTRSSSGSSRSGGRR